MDNDRLKLIALELTDCKGDPLDLCQCGDYRQSHPNNGACMFNDGKCGHGYGGDGHYGAGLCHVFRLEQTREEQLIEQQRFKNHNVFPIQGLKT